MYSHKTLLAAMCYVPCSQGLAGQLGGQGQENSVNRIAWQLLTKFQKVGRQMMDLKEVPPLCLHAHMLLCFVFMSPCRCLNPKPSSRPTADVVVKALSVLQNHRGVHAG